MFHVEIAALIGVTLVTVAPLTFGYRMLGLSSDALVNVYFGASLVIVALAHLRYIYPFRTFRITNLKFYLGAFVVMIVLLESWLTGNFGRILNFSDMNQGAIFAPLVFAMSFPIVQAIPHVAAANSIQNMAADRSGS